VVQQIAVVVNFLHSAYLSLDEFVYRSYGIRVRGGTLGSRRGRLEQCRGRYAIVPSLGIGGLDVHRFSASSGAVERQLRAMNAALETLLDALLELHDIRSALASPGLGPEEVRELRARRAHLPLRVEAVGEDFADALSERRLAADEVVAVWRRACRVSELVAWDRVWERRGQ
jgi:hypothetical protein